MREILFRGKRNDNGEWIYGYLLESYSMKWILNPLSDGGFKWFLVDNNTICQFTGLFDKNGNKIWENDIVDTHNRGVGYSRLEKVIYENGGFFPISTHGWECEPDADEIEVIGNVFDNKELLEE